MRPLGSLLVVILALAAASGTRKRMRSGVLGQREAYGRPLSDWAALSVLGLGCGLAALVAGINWLAFLLVCAVLLESYATVSQVRPQRRRR